MKGTPNELAAYLASGRQPLDKFGRVAVDRRTCPTCGRSWDDARITAYTPTPSGRCPFEYFHDGDGEDA
jgi:hypothetical protein